MANSDPDVSTPDLLQQAMQGFQMYEQGRYDEARVIFQELSALDPKEGYYRTALGATLLAVDDLDESLVHFNEAIRLNDADTAALSRGGPQGVAGAWLDAGRVRRRSGRGGGLGK